MQDAKGQPMQEVSAREKNTTTEIITQANGSCRLAVSSETATLVFSLVGSQSQEITLSGSPTIHTTLPVDYSHIDEVLAIGYQSIRRKDLTGAVSVVERQNTSAKVARSSPKALQGQASGLELRNSGGHGQGAVLNIRGLSTLYGNAGPLYVIGGMLSGTNVSFILKISKAYRCSTIFLQRQFLLIVIELRHIYKVLVRLIGLP